MIGFILVLILLLSLANQFDLQHQPFVFRRAVLVLYGQASRAISTS